MDDAQSHRFLLLATSLLSVSILAQDDHLQRPGSGSDKGFGQVHMDVSCSPAVAADFDRALALLHNFWYVRAFERFNQVLKNDPGWQGRTVAREQFQALFRFEVMFVNT